MHVDLWSHTGKKSRVIAVIRSEEGKVSIEEKERMPASYRNEIMKTRERVTGDDEAFLRQLTVEFSGSYIKAHFLAD